MIGIFPRHCSRDATFAWCGLSLPTRGQCTGRIGAVIAAAIGDMSTALGGAKQADFTFGLVICRHGCSLRGGESKPPEYTYLQNSGRASLQPTDQNFQKTLIINEFVDPLVDQLMSNPAPPGIHGSAKSIPQSFLGGLSPWINGAKKCTQLSTSNFFKVCELVHIL